MTSEQRDQWAQWILQRRHGSDPEMLRQQLALLALVRDNILTSAAIEPGQAVLDVGCGDGLIGFAAAETVGPSGTVIFSDISPNLLDLCRDLVLRAINSLHNCNLGRRRRISTN